MDDAPAAARLAATSATCTCGTRLQLSSARAHSATCAHAAACATALQASGVAASAAAASHAAPRSRLVFACPLCPPSASGGARDAPSLAEHVEQAHAGEHAAVVCPVCAAMPWGSDSYVSRDWVGHVRLRHRFSYEVRRHRHRFALS